MKPQTYLSPKLQSFLNLYVETNLSLEFVGMGIWLVECWKMEEMMSHFDFWLYSLHDCILCAMELNLSFSIII